MENVIVASSNVYAVYALTAWYNDSIVYFAILASMMASIVYHLVEHHKHDMPGTAGSGSLSEHKLCLNLDRFCAILLGIVLLSRAIDNPSMIYNPASILCAVCAAGFGIVSEHGESFFKHISSKQRRWIYIVTHSVWHVLIFNVVYLCAQY